MSGEPSRHVPVTPLTQEVRLATTMTGGVSLAVWMGGVAREINLLSQASDFRLAASRPDARVCEFSATTPSGQLLDLYLKLLELLDAVVDVDVLSGTSAGGINAALLGFARVNNRDLGGLRELWLDLGSMLDLLRNPTDTDVPSLMYGDRKMFADLVNELPRLPEAPVNRDASSGLPPTTVYITTTLLSGETSRFTDSFGTLVRDLDHHGLFTFDEKALKAGNGSDENVRALALAARSTASFPAAFEPSFLPVGNGMGEMPGVPGRPDMRRYGNLTLAHWAADGGLLDNQPIDVLIDRIFERSAERPVRRALLFVVPTSGPESSDAVLGDSSHAPLGLVDSLLKDLGAVTSQSITRDLNRLREHNDRMTARIDARLRLAELAERLNDGSILSQGLFADYCAREATRVATKVVPGVLEQLTEMSIQSDQVRSALALGGDAESICRASVEDRLRSGWLTEAPQGDSECGGPSTLDALARLDQPAFDVATAVALAYVRAAFQVADNSERDVVVAALNAVHASRPATRENSSAVAGLVVDGGATLSDVASGVADQWRRDNTVTDTHWIELAEAVKRLAVVPAGHSQEPAGAHPSSVAATKAAAARTLRTYRNYLSLSGTADVVALRLFQLGGAQRAMLPASADQEQPLELIQVSADTRSLLAPQRGTARSKLTGLQFHHFGAFYKRSWRANDWMWGRVDGVGWLVHILLDPRRLQLVCDQNGQTTQRASWLLHRLATIAGPLPGDGTDPEVTLDNGVVIDHDALSAELAFLDDATAPVPRSLPLTALWVARAFQRKVLDDEIPHVLDAIGDGKPDADWSPAKTVAWAREVKAGQKMGDERLDTCPVAEETLTTEFGSRLMVRTVAKAAATAAGALAGVKQVPAAGKPALSTMRTITLGGYRAVTATGARPRWLVGAGTVLLIAGVASAIRTSSVFGLGGAGLASIGAYVIAFGAWQQRDRLLPALGGVTLVGALGALTSTWARHHLFGTSSTDDGWIGRHMHWIGASWWRPLTVIGAILLAGALVAVVIPRVVSTLRKRADSSRAKRVSVEQAEARTAARARANLEPISSLAP